MFKKVQRFSFRNGAPRLKLSTPLFFVRYELADTPTYGVVVSKSVSKKATQRNTAKRLVLLCLKEALLKRQNASTFVLFLRRPYTEYQKSVIITEVESILDRVNS